MKTKILSAFLKCAVVLGAAIGIPLSVIANEAAFMSGKSVFMFFTVQSNILMALICMAGLIFMVTGKKPAPWWYVLKYVSTVAITLTGIVFCFVLAPTLGSHAWNVQNILTHVVVPVAAIADFYVSSAEAKISRKAVFLVTIPPILYAIYAGIGFALNWQFAPGYNYPYFFLNWGSPAGAFGFSKGLPFMGTGWWIVAILIFLLGIGYLYLYTLDKCKKKN
ncbi:MAG: Pr6Pr family membrane protein [Lachnospiraceae bacterium]|nr:Pr6Pr family membrane protein [Lachnospiraceae bacterium]